LSTRNPPWVLDLLDIFQKGGREQWVNRRQKNGACNPNLWVYLAVFSSPFQSHSESRSFQLSQTNLPHDLERKTHSDEVDREMGQEKVSHASDVYLDFSEQIEDPLTFLPY
jgi:hypothetical protein